MSRKIRTCLWFDNQAEEAATFYASIFDDSKIENVSRFSEGGPGPAGKAIAVDIKLEGRAFTALNCGVSRQVVAAILPSLIAGPDPHRSQRAMQAMLGMAILDIAELRRPYDG